ncbi:type 4a pilus biogenesis protein PilO [Isoalcanivorax beigongshangi]|uniref:Type 4a pilus biogenesis protein PilO n=1 Tax=Isoalcanivorax beigongshangi TaxID=3238810 RepID=A0ABV4AMH1_9GAMM
MKASELKNIDIGELFQKLQELDFENVGSWPVAAKAAAAVLVLAAVVFLGYMLSITSLYEDLERAQDQEQSLMTQLRQKAHRAHFLPQYREQLTEMSASLESLVQQLPKDTEVPGLLEDITHTGLGSSLEFERIALAAEVEKEFYVELPIQIEVTGSYHGMGAFVSGVAALPRIVTLHDFSILPQPARGRDKDARDAASQPLVMKITAKTYRYAERPPAPPRNTSRNNRRR